MHFIAQQGQRKARPGRQRCGECIERRSPVPCNNDAAGGSSSSTGDAARTRGVSADRTAAPGGAAGASSNGAGDAALVSDASADSAAVPGSRAAAERPSSDAGDAAGSRDVGLEARRSAEAEATARRGCEWQSGAALVLARPDEWQQALDYASGCFYYYRESTQVQPFTCVRRCRMFL